MRGKAKTGASRLKKGKVKKKGKLEPPDEAIDVIKKDQKGLCVGDKCFTGDTLVYTKHGYKPIKEIFKGDEVYSRDEKTGETSLKEVIETFRTTTHTVYHIWADGKEEFKTTAYHPVYVQEQGWVTAINLREGDTIETMDGLVHITKVEKTRHEEKVPVYNFHVKDWVSYFVGKICVYVHNDERTNHVNSILKFSDMTESEIIDIAEKYRKKAPIEIPGTAKYKAKSMTDGYEQISYKWTDGTYKYEARWHTRTSGAPVEQGNTWVVQRTLPGNGGIKPSTKFLVGEDDWVEGWKWYDAIKARKNGTATKKQIELLDKGHWKE